MGRGGGARALCAIRLLKPRKMVTFACTSCGHEWGIEEAKAAEEEFITRDVNGAELRNGDQVVLTKDLAKGSLKKGLKVPLG